jgi:hypothetical protein
MVPRGCVAPGSGWANLAAFAGATAARRTQLLHRMQRMNWMDRLTQMLLTRIDVEDVY